MHSQALPCAATACLTSAPLDLFLLHLTEGLFTFLLESWSQHRFLSKNLLDPLPTEPPSTHTLTSLELSSPLGTSSFIPNWVSISHPMLSEPGIGCHTQHTSVYSTT